MDERKTDGAPIRRRGLMIGGVLLLAVSAGLSGAQTPAKEPLRIPRFDKAPRIDGVLDDLWAAQGLKIDDFIQLSPKENGTPTEKTTAWLGFDENNFYFAFRCLDSQIGKLRCSVTNRDGCLEDDWVFLFVDTFNEKRRAFTFILNPIGVQYDGMRTEGGGNDNIDNSWDTVFASEGKVDAEGWTVEGAIPFKSLRFPDANLKTWNLVIGRNLPRTGEVVMWPRYSREIPGLLMQGGLFNLEGPVKKGRNLEVMPVVTSLKREGRGVDFEPGANVKYGLNSDMTLDLTVNPDFSHIEADAPQIDYNLRYALRYAEKRPFFLEGMEIFQYPDIEMVYTRRIIDPLAGVKLSGKTGRFAYGVLSSFDQHPSESLWDVHGGSGESDKKALFNIFRVKADVFNKESYLGFTLADKEIDGSWNRVAGIDGQWRFKNRIFFSFQAIAAKTRTDGADSAVAPALYADLFYQTKYWGAGAFWQAIHPEFEASSGFVNRVDYRVAGAYTWFTFYTDKPWLNQIRINLNLRDRLGYFDDVRQDRQFQTRVQFRLTEFNVVNVQYRAGRERYEDLDFRKNAFYVEAETQFIRWLPFYGFFQTGDAINYDPDDPFRGWSDSYGLGMTLKPSKRLQLGVDLSKETFWRSLGGERLWDYNVVRQRTTYQISKALSLRAIVDYNHFYKQWFGSFLVSYVPRPGTVFFLGLDSNYFRNPSGHYGRENYSVFLKFSYWWRV